MKRLTETTQYPLTTFKRCQLCGFEDSDICYFRLWRECDDADKPEPYTILAVCRQEDCQTVIRDHERLYVEIPWGMGEPGHLVLLCSDCSWREGGRCTHPDLKANSGAGLDLAYESMIPGAIACYHDDSKPYGMRCGPLPAPFTRCAGLPPDHPRHYQKKEDDGGNV